MVLQYKYNFTYPWCTPYSILGVQSSRCSTVRRVAGALCTRSIVVAIVVLEYDSSTVLLCFMRRTCGGGTGETGTPFHCYGLRAIGYRLLWAVGVIITEPRIVLRTGVFLNILAIVAPRKHAST